MVYKTPRSESPVAPYPGYEYAEDWSVRTPSPQPRVKPEGEPYAIRNRGSIGNWVFNYYGEHYDSPRPVPRCPTPAAHSNYEIGRNGTVKNLLRDSVTARPRTAPPRVKSEGEAIASLSRGKRMKTFIHKYAQSGPTPRAPRITKQAEDHAEVHKGGRMDKLVHSYGKVPLSDRAVPRVKTEGEDNADLDKGKRIDKLVHNHGRLPMSARLPPRVTDQGYDNADLDKGKRMNRLLHEYAKKPLSCREVPRVKQEGDPNYKLDFGKRMCTLMHDVKKYPSSPCLAPRVQGSEASAILRKSRGQMGRIFNESGKRTCIHKPGVQNTKYCASQTL